MHFKLHALQSISLFIAGLFQTEDESEAVHPGLPAHGRIIIKYGEFYKIPH